MRRWRLLAVAGLLITALVAVWGVRYVRPEVAASRAGHAVTPGPVESPGAAADPTLAPTPTTSAAPSVAPSVAPSTTGQQAAPPSPARSSPSVLWGLWEPHWQTGGSTDFTAYTNVENQLAHLTDIVHWYANWDESWSYDGGLVKKVVQSDRTPMITWEAWNRPLSAIVAGQFDSYIDTWARGMAAYAPHPIYLRIFHEFNDPRAGESGYPWGVGGGTSNQPASLVAAWRHIHDRFVAAGATSVRFVWCPDGVNLDLNRLRAAYPGDTYVDFAGWDAYGYDIAAAYQTLSQVTPKPFVLAEMAGDPSWVRDLTGKLRSGGYGRIRALVWFDEGKWRLDANPAVRPVVKDLLAGVG